jgi:ABC-type transport system involved in multi-copper enzyme maturation permease subunit
VRSLDRIRVIAESTFLESVRDRALAVPLLLGGLMLGAALFTRTLSLGCQGKLIQDFGLAGMCLSTDVLVILTVAATLARGMDRGAVLPVLVKPVRRSELLVGKFGGVLAVGCVNIALLLLGLYASMLLLRTTGSPGILWAAALAAVEAAVVAAFAVLFSVVSSPVPAMVFGGLTMLIGHASMDVHDLAGQMGNSSARVAGDVLYWLLPNLEVFDVRGAAVHGLPIAPSYVASAVVYGALYAALVLFASVWAFERRDLV